MKCASCGTDIIMDAEGRTRFCPKCGSKLVMSAGDTDVNESGDITSDLIRSKSALGEGRYADAKRFAEAALSKDINSPDGWYLKACALRYIDDTIYLSCLNRARELNRNTPFVIVNKESAERIFTADLNNPLSESDIRDAYEYSASKMRSLFADKDPSYIPHIDECINDIRSTNASVLSDRTLGKFLSNIFDDIDRQVNFTDELTVQNWDNIVRSTYELLPQMFACFALDVSLRPRLQTAIDALHNVAGRKWTSKFRPAAVKAIDTRQISAVTARIKIYYDWIRTLR